MKVFGKYFKHCMESNIFRISGKSVRVHCWSIDGIGAYRVLANDADKGSQEEIEFFLKKSDADILCSFDELDVSVNEKTHSTTFKNGSTAIRFQNPADVSEPEPAIKETAMTSFSAEEFARAAALADKDNKDGGKTTAGVVFAKEDIMLYDAGLSLYYRRNGGADLNGPEKPVRVPTGMLKIIAGNLKDYAIRISEKLIVMMSDFEVVYSGTYAGYKPELVGYDPIAEGQIAFTEAGDFMHHIRMCSAFAPLVKLTVENGVLKIENYLNNSDPRLYSTELPIETNIEKYSTLFSTKALTKLFTGLQIKDDEELVLRVNDKLLRADAEDRFIVIAATVDHDGTKLELKGETQNEHE